MADSILATEFVIDEAVELRFCCLFYLTRIKGDFQSFVRVVKQDATVVLSHGAPPEAVGITTLVDVALPNPPNPRSLTLKWRHTASATPLAWCIEGIIMTAISVYALA